MLTFGAGGGEGGVFIGGGVDGVEASGSCGAGDVMHLTEKFVRFLLGSWVVVVRGVTVVVAVKSKEAAIV